MALKRLKSKFVIIFVSIGIFTKSFTCFTPAKKSKRITGKLKHKIEKKVREHNRKIKRDAKKNPKKGNKKQKLIQIPNICPFKEDILKDVEEAKKRKDEERLKRRDAFKAQKDKNRSNSLAEIVADATIRETIHSISREVDFEDAEVFLYIYVNMNVPK